MEVSFREALGGSSRCEIVDWLETKKQKREDGKRWDDNWYVIGEVSDLHRGVGCDPAKVFQPCRWCDAEPQYP
jgi:hypothetical protein